MGNHHSGLRRLASVAAATIIGGTAALFAPLHVSAAPPQVVFEDRWDDTFVLDHLCEEGPVTIHTTGMVRLTQFFDNEGNLVRETILVNATDIISSDEAELFDRWAWAGTFDAATETFFERGNQWNVHAGAGGVLVNDSGLIRFTFDEEGEFVVLKVAGPRDTFPDGPGDPCPLLFP